MNQLFSSITLFFRNVRKRGGTFRKTYSGGGDSRSIFRSGIRKIYQAEDLLKSKAARGATRIRSDNLPAPLNSISSPLRFSTDSSKVTSPGRLLPQKVYSNHPLRFLRIP